MGIKTYNPYTPSRRHMTSSDFSEITKTKPEKSLVVSLKKTQDATIREDHRETSRRRQQKKIQTGGF